MIDTQTPGSPGWWAKRLAAGLHDRQADYTLLADYARGDHPLPTGAEKCAESYRRLQAKARTNYVGLVSQAVTERMVPVGFRTGADRDEIGDDVAWRVWQANQLDADCGLIHDAVTVMGDAYVIVGPQPDGGDIPLITPEDPRQVITASAPGRWRSVDAALKTWADDITDEERAVLYLPGAVYHFKRHRKAGTGVHEDGTFDGSVWDLDEQASGTLPLSRVPVIRFANRPDLYGQSVGEFADVLDIQDRINHTILDRLVVASMQAFRQRWVKGLSTKDAKGDPVDLNSMLSASAGAVWALPPTVEIGEFEETSLKPLLDAVSEDVRALGAITRTPPSYLLAELVNVSADAYTVTESGLVAKVGNRLLQAGESWEAVLSLAFEIMGDEQRRQRHDLEVLWANPKRHTLSEIGDAATKLKDVVSRRTLQRDILQMTPQAMARDESDRAGELLDTMLAAEPAVTTEPTVGP